MTEVQLDVLLAYLQKILYFIERCLPREQNEELIGIMQDIRECISPIQKRLLEKKFESKN